MHLARAADVHENGTIVISPAICGDKILSEGEECDDGLLGNSAEKADSCRPINCTKASCGDGVTDSGEQCDEGPSGGLNCTKECQAICPVLPNLTEAEKYTFAVNCTARNYADSVNYCKAQGTQIASIHNNKDNNVVVNLVNQAGCIAYLGAESNGKGTWSWNDGTKWDFVPTKNDGMQGKSETKAAMNKDDSAWHDWGTGSEKLGVVCLKFSSSRSGSDSDADADTDSNAEQDLRDMQSLANDCPGLNLRSIKSPFRSTTTLPGNNNTVPECGKAHDQLFYVDIAPGGSVDIGQLSNDYDSTHSLRWGGACPGKTLVQCADDPDTLRLKWTNDRGVTHRVYYVQSGFGAKAGSFTLSWTVTGADPSTGENEDSTVTKRKTTATSKPSVSELMIQECKKSP